MSRNKKQSEIMLIVILVVICCHCSFLKIENQWKSYSLESLCQTTRLNWLIFNFSLLVLETIILEPVQRKYILNSLLSSKMQELGYVII